MKTNWMSLVGVSLGLVLLSGGCPASDARLSDQGGTSPLSLAEKINAIQAGTGEFTDLNADDFQLMMDMIIEQANVDLPPMSNELAQALVDLLAANGIRTAADFDRLGVLLAENPEALIIPASVTEEILLEVQNYMLGLQGADLSGVQAP